MAPFQRSTRHLEAEAPRALAHIAAHMAQVLLGLHDLKGVGITGRGSPAHRLHRLTPRLPKRILEGPGIPARRNQEKGVNVRVPTVAPEGNLHRTGIGHPPEEGLDPPMPPGPPPGRGEGPEDIGQGLPPGVPNREHHMHGPVAEPHQPGRRPGQGLAPVPGQPRGAHRASPRGPAGHHPGESDPVALLLLHEEGRYMGLLGGRVPAGSEPPEVVSVGGERPPDHLPEAVGEGPLAVLNEDFGGR